MATISIRTMTVLLALMPAILFASPIMTPGAWQMTMKVTAINPNTGQKVNVGNTSTTFCLTPEFLATDPYLNPTLDQQKMQQKGAECSISGHERSGNTASWKMSCTMRGQQIESMIRTSVFPKSHNNKIDQVVGSGSNAVRSLTLVNSRYIGECTDNMLRP